MALSQHTPICLSANTTRVPIYLTSCPPSFSLSVADRLLSIPTDGRAPPVYSEVLGECLSPLTYLECQVRALPTDLEEFGCMPHPLTWRCCDACPTHYPGCVVARAQPTYLGMLGKCPAHLPCRVLGESPAHLPGSVWARAQPTNLEGLWRIPHPLTWGCWVSAPPTYLRVLNECFAHLPGGAGQLFCQLT
jgi:hypothetical protein